MRSHSATIPLPTRRTTKLLARRVAALASVGDVIYLEGPLGAGKTFFTRALCRALGVDAGVPVQSPTFSLIHVLEGSRAGHPLGIVHCDFYRLHTDEEVDELGLRELMPDHVLVVEWGLRFRRAIGPGLQLTFSFREGVRGVELAATGGRAEAILRALEASGEGR